MDNRAGKKRLENNLAMELKHSLKKRNIDAELTIIKDTE